MAQGLQPKVQRFFGVRKTAVFWTDHFERKNNKSAGGTVLRLRFEGTDQLSDVGGPASGKGFAELRVGDRAGRSLPDEPSG
jgi:hypothetical protein